MLRDSYNRGQKVAVDVLSKYAGGPGSGVKEHNTAPIDFPQSKHVSIGTRKALLDNMYYRKEVVPLSSITAVGQKNLIPEKLKRMVDDPNFKDVLKEKTVDLLRVGEDDYHVIDGHHRVLAAAMLGVNELSAKVRRKSKRTMKTNDRK